MATRSGADDAVPDWEDCCAETVDAEKAASPLVRKRIAKKVWRMVAPQMRRHPTIEAPAVSSKRMVSAGSLEISEPWRNR